MAPRTEASHTKACFVCGKTGQGKRVSMSNHKLKYSKCEILEKLGRVVGDDLLVVCYKGDIICQHCVSVMEVIDKLEYELASSKRVILRLLEKKYNLKTKVEYVEEEPQPETITQNTETIFAARKRESEKLVEELANSLDDPRERVWLECDKCHYTTNYPTFVDRHVRQKPCPNCGHLMQDGLGLCAACTNGHSSSSKLDTPIEEPGPSVSPSTFLEDDCELGQIVKGETLDTSQVQLTETENEAEEDPDQPLEFMEFVDEGENEEKTEVFNVSDTIETEDIWVG